MNLYSGVEHVAGDMLEKVPTGDAILIKVSSSKILIEEGIIILAAALLGSHCLSTLTQFSLVFLKCVALQSN